MLLHHFLNTNVHQSNSLRLLVGDTMVNIAVLVKQVPDTNSKIQITGDRVDLSSVKMDISHKIYEEMRLFGLSKERRNFLEKKLVKEWDNVIAPPDWEDILKLDNFKDYFKNWDNYL